MLMNLSNKRIILISFILFNLYVDESHESDPGDVEKYLQTGTKLLAAGQLVDALAQYDKAIDGDPKNYLIYYRRATVFLAMGKTNSAIEDLSSSLNLNPNFTPARTQRANLYLKQGKLSEAKEDIKLMLEIKPEDAEAQKLLSTVGDIAMAIENAKMHNDNENYPEAIQFLDKAIEVAVLSAELRELRSNIHLKTGNPSKAIQDLRATLKLSNDDRKGILRLSKLLYETGNAEQSLVDIRECLKLDPDDKDCFSHYKSIKKLVQLLNSIQDAIKENRFTDCITKATKLKQSEPFYVGEANQYLCKCHTKGGDPKVAVNICETAHQFDPSNLDVLCDVAEAHIADEGYEESIKYYQKVLDADRGHQRAKEGINKAQKLLKNSKKRNYYKILGVTKYATKKEILKAYRKLAAEYHPDRYKGDNKKQAERQFIDITDAKDVLTNQEKRQKYDNGEDPLDPEQQHRGASDNPFGGFTFHNFHSFDHDGGFEFHFG